LFLWPPLELDPLGRWVASYHAPMKLRNKPVRDTVIRAIGGVGLHVTDRIAPEELRRLIRSLRPVYGGFELIRLGPDGDGGYLIPDDLEGIEYAFSPGVQTESGFEAALAARGLRVFLADFSVDGPAQSDPNFFFRKKHVGCMSDDTFMTLEEWKSAAIGPYEGDLLLQMDIEGGELETLLCSPAGLLSQFRIMVIEVHYLQELFNKPFFDLASRVFQKLLQTHSVVHIHPNNCCGSVRGSGLEVPRVAEFTFHRNDRFQQRSYCCTFPHPLDRNNTRKATVVLPTCWYE
jgi:hypothetical protein